MSWLCVGYLFSTSGTTLLIQFDVNPALALVVAEAVERRRIALAVNGGLAPIGLAEVRDEFMRAAKDRQDPTKLATFEDLFDALLVAPRLLRIAQVATALASSSRTVERLIAAGELPTVRLGDGSTRVRVTDLDAYVESLPVIERKSA
jgi:excisionase family DNA binding protein